MYSNYELGAALRDANYDYKLVIGTEAHNSKHGSAILPDALRWLWRDYPKPIAKPTGGARHYITNNIVTDSDSGWELAGQGYKFTEGPAVDAQGNVFFSDIPNSRIHKISADGKVTIFRENTGESNGLMFGPDGRLYACQNGRKRIVAFAADGKESVIAEGVSSNDLAINPRGEIYFTRSGEQTSLVYRCEKEQAGGQRGNSFSQWRPLLAGPRLPHGERYVEPLGVEFFGAARWIARERSSLLPAGNTG